MRDMTDLIIYNRFEEPVGIISNKTENSCHYRSDSHPEQLGGVIRYNLEVQNGHEYSNYLEKDGFIGLKDYDGEYMLFKIILEPERSRDWIYVQTENGFIDELLNPINPIFLQSQTAKQAVTAFLQGTRVSVGNVEWFGVKDILIDDYPTPLEAIYRVAEEFEGEISFRIKLLGNRIVGRYIDLVKKRGRNNNVRFDYGVDLQDIVREGGEVATTITAVVPLGPADTAGNRMSIAGVSASDKPLENNWIGDEDSRKKFGMFYDGEMHHRKVKVEFNEAQTPQELLILGRKYLDEHKEPEVSYKLTVALLERLSGYEHKAVRIGDTVTIVDSSFNPPVAIEARVIELTRSYSDPSQDSLTLGNFKPLRPRFRLEDLYSQVGKNKGKWESNFVPPWIDDEPPLDTTRTWYDNSNGVPYTQKEYNNVLQEWVVKEPTKEERYLMDFMVDYDEALLDIAEAQFEIDNIFTDLDKKLTIDEDYDGVVIGTDTGLVSTRLDGMTQAVANAEDGFALRRNNGSGWVNTLWADPLTGGLKMRGELEAATGTFAGQLIAATGTFTGQLNAASGTFTGQLIAATGSFSGTVTASVIKSSRFETMKGDQIYFNAVTDANGNITSYGGRIDTAGELARFQRNDGDYISIATDGEIGMWSDAYRFFEFNAVESLQHSFLRGGNAALKFLNGTDTMIQVRNVTDTAYRSLKVDELIQVSDPAEKKNVEEYAGNALNGVLGMNFSMYHMHDDDDTEPKRFGVMLPDAPMEIVSPRSGIIPYAASLYSMKAIQELHDIYQTKITELETRLGVLEDESTTV